MSCCRRSRDVDVEVADIVVAMVEVVVVDVVVVICRVAAIAGGAKNCAVFCFGRGCSCGRFAPCRGTVGGVLRMSEDAVVVVGETTSFAKTGGSSPSTQRFCQNRVRSCRGYHNCDAGVSMQS